MTELDEAMKKHMTSIVTFQHRPYSFLDFLYFRVDGKYYYMSHGTFRNKISRLKKSGLVELECNSVPRFYTLKGVNFGRKKAMTRAMTLDHTGDTPVISVINNSLYNTIQNLPPDQKALHDIHMKFQVPDIWKIISLSGKYTINPSNKDISLPLIASNNLKLRITVHRTDTVTVVAACSNAPIVINEAGIIRFYIALTRIEERLSRIVDECGSNLEGGYESIPIPEHDSWTVTMWHVGTDDSNYKEFVSGNGCATWQDSHRDVLCREYVRKNKHNKNAYNFRTRQNNDSIVLTTIRRKEIQEYPKKTLSEAIQEKLSKGGCRSL